MNRGNKYHAVSTRKFLNVIIGLKKTKDLDRLIKQLEQVESDKKQYFVSSCSNLIFNH